MNRYYHRSINIPKLVEARFTPVPRSLTLARMIRLYKLPSATRIAGLREMEDKDVEEVTELFGRYSKRFDMAPVMTMEEIRHNFLSGQGSGEVTSGRRDGQVIWSYVVEVKLRFFWYLTSDIQLEIRTLGPKKLPTSLRFILFHPRLLNRIQLS
jgi:hypothetical protein